MNTGVLGPLLRRLRKGSINAIGHPCRKCVVPICGSVRSSFHMFYTWNYVCIFNGCVRLLFRVARISGTLSPLDSFAGELSIDFPHRLEAPHVINVAKQCLVTSVGFFDGVSLDARQDVKRDPGVIGYNGRPVFDGVRRRLIVSSFPCYSCRRVAVIFRYVIGQRPGTGSQSRS